MKTNEDIQIPERKTVLDFLPPRESVYIKIRFVDLSHPGEVGV